jgi:hypothetical protein
MTDPHRRNTTVQDAMRGVGEEHDQGRARLMKMRRGYGRLQGGIPGEGPRGSEGYSELPESYAREGGADG